MILFDDEFIRRLEPSFKETSKKWGSDEL